MYKRSFFRLGIAVLALTGLLIARYIVLGGATKRVSLVAAPSLTGVVSQSLAASQKAARLPIANQDYRLQDIRYFDNANWAVANIQPIDNAFDPGFVIFEKLQGAYEVVLGPGSAFDSSYQLNLPKDVSQYLSEQGVFYESTD
jgi:hypothetical protein